MRLHYIVMILSVTCYPKYLRELWWRYVIPKRINQLGVNAAASVRFYGMPIITLARGSKVKVGENSVICSNSSKTDLGVNHPVVLRTLRPGAEIIIGKNTGISGGSICAAIRIEIGNECLLGANVTIVDTDFHAINPKGRRFNNNPRDIKSKPTIIEDNVFIGTGVTILKGVRIGRNSVIGAGSVVITDVPENSVAAGSPARLIRDLVKDVESVE